MPLPAWGSPIITESPRCMWRPRAVNSVPCKPWSMQRPMFLRWNRLDGKVSGGKFRVPLLCGGCFFKYILWNAVKFMKNGWQVFIASRGGDDDVKWYESIQYYHIVCDSYLNRTAQSRDSAVKGHNGPKLSTSTWELWHLLTFQVLHAWTSQATQVHTPCSLGRAPLHSAAESGHLEVGAARFQHKGRKGLPIPSQVHVFVYAMYDEVFLGNQLFKQGDMILS